MAALAVAPHIAAQLGYSELFAFWPLARRKSSNTSPQAVCFVGELPVARCEAQKSSGKSEERGARREAMRQMRPCLLPLAATLQRHSGSRVAQSSGYTSCSGNTSSRGRRSTVAWAG